jgi:hypothetical protein
MYAYEYKRLIHLLPTWEEGHLKLLIWLFGRRELRRKNKSISAANPIFTALSHAGGRAFETSDLAVRTARTKEEK